MSLLATLADAPPVLVGALTHGDELLIARVAAGDDRAVGELFDHYGPLLFGIAKRVSGDQAVAEDVLQEVLTELWRHPERFDHKRGSLRAYLGVQAHRRTVDAIRRDVRRKAREERWELLSLASAFGKDAVEQAVLGEVVRRAIDRLPSEQRRAIELAFWDGQTHKEVAQVLGLPEGTVKSRLRLAQAKLALWLAPIELEAL
jgi:RNA polymerase sigma factor (sigma-70 family)